jgi:hypothetical protein
LNLSLFPTYKIGHLINVIGIRCCCNLLEQWLLSVIRNLALGL